MEEIDTTRIPETSEAVFERRKVAVKQSIDEYHGYLQNYLYGLTR